ncbi:MAG TPA: PQQ-binding-like beta-propeller repeat protein, partial [Vicinamibacteria bacterium]
MSLAALLVSSLAVQGIPEGTLVFGGFEGEFFANGSYRIEGEGWPALAGTFTVTGSELVLVPAAGGAECNSPGRYTFAVEAGRLSLRLASDDCTPRRMILDGSIWRSAGERETLPERRIVRSSGDVPRALPEPESSSGSWPSFRGPHAAGVAEGQKLPDQWNGETGENVLWKAPIAGLAHSSPIVWGDRIFATSAISSRGGASFRPGLYGDGDASDDRSPQKWMIYAIDKHTGETLWERTVYEGVPIDKRHVKSTYASATPSTDGRVVVASFGSQGIYAYDVEGRFLWKVDLGRLNLGAYDIPTFEWGPASSPILWHGVVFVQCDTQDDSFLLALDADSGETLWKSDRDELPSWSTPSVYEGPSGAELVTNAPNYIRGYDPLTGKELWRLGGSSKITAPTPVFADGLIVVASGRRPEQPLFVVRAGARGDLTLSGGSDSSESVVWSRTRRGPYMPTPLVYQGILYVLANNGVFDAYDLATGKEIYRERIPHLGSGFSASPVAADGKIYLSNEDGEMIVVKAGAEFGHIATNPMGELLMATPALSEGVMYVRGMSHLFAIGRRPETTERTPRGGDAFLDVCTASV